MEVNEKQEQAVEQTVEQTVEQEQAVEQTVEQTVEQEQAVEQTEKEFTLDDINFDNDESIYKVGGYDLAKFKDHLVDDLGTVEVENSLAELQKLGFTQEQFEWLVSKGLEKAQTEEIVDYKKVQEDFNKNLTNHEKRNYNFVKTELHNILSGTEQEDLYKSVMTDTTAFKLVNRIMEYYGKGSNIGKEIGAKTQRETRNAPGKLDYLQALDKISSFMDTAPDEKTKQEFFKGLYGQIANDEDLAKIKDFIGG